MPDNCSEYVKELLARKGLADLDEFKSEHVLDLVLVNTSPLYIGSGQAEPLGNPVDLAVVRGTVAEVVGNEVKVYDDPIIPGSSLKGVLRSLAESIAISLGKLAATMKLGEEEVSCTADRLDKIESWLNKNCDNNHMQTISAYMDTCFASPVALLFGAPWVSSRLSFYDAYPVGMEPPKTKVVTRVAIDRLTGTQKPKQLYTMEFVEAGTRWRARIRLFNLDPFSDNEAAKLLRLVLKTLAEQGITVGGRISIGHGALRLIVDESKIVSTRLDPEKATFVHEEIPLQKLLEKAMTR